VSTAQTFIKQIVSLPVIVYPLTSYLTFLTQFCWLYENRKNLQCIFKWPSCCIFTTSFQHFHVTTLDVRTL